jgi:hypothetical protein
MTLPMVRGGGSDQTSRATPSVTSMPRDSLALSMPLHVVRHPVIEDSLARLRDRTTPCDEFRRLARRVSLLLAAEATRDLALSETSVETPLETASVFRIASRGTFS